MSEIDEAADPAALIEAYYDAGWTDGLPVVPPSDASIAAMLAAGPGASPRGPGQERRRAALKPAQRFGCGRGERRSGSSGRIGGAQAGDELRGSGGQGGFADKFATGETHGGN